MAELHAYCASCDRWFEVVDDPTLDASYLCPVCLAPGARTEQHASH